eukprot:gene26125-biopygen14199
MNSCHEEGVHDRIELESKLLIPRFAWDRAYQENKREGTSQGVRRVGCGCIRRNAGGGRWLHPAFGRK